MSRLRTWAQLLRLPNLFTVPGDALAGALLTLWRVPSLRAGRLDRPSSGPASG
ncbi:MAG: hypothetical protein ACYTGH_10640 [Planctomycetota bacterium]